ncbi:MAG: HAD-IIIA family hydrolase [Chloroflexi bacterium]|nr:HAD-IIIA family hydrolase [Chloroflexota bacterium]
MSHSSAPAVFLDKDGTLIDDVPYNVDPGRVVLTKGAIEGLRLLHAAGFRLVIVTNQSGVARGLFPESALVAVEERLRELLASAGVPLVGFYYCPHHPDGVVRAYARACGCRKPEPGLILRAADELRLDLARSWTIGDISSDVEAGRRAGVRSILLEARPQRVVLRPQAEEVVPAGSGAFAEFTFARTKRLRMNAEHPSSPLSALPLDARGEVGYRVAPRSWPDFVAVDLAEAAEQITGSGR